MKKSQGIFLRKPTLEMSNKQILIWLAVIILLLTACANSTSEKRGGSSRKDLSLAEANPCSMLTPEEIELIFEEAATGDTEPTTNGPITGCTFRNERGGRFFLIQLGPETVLEVDSQDPDVTVLEGLGDEATFSYGSLRVRVGETVLQITTYHSSSKQDEALKMTQDIARIALNQLP